MHSNGNGYFELQNYYFYLNKCSLGEHKVFFPLQKKGTKAVSVAILFQ